MMRQLLLESLCRPIEVLGHTLSVSASIGIGLYPEDGESAEILLKHANTAMSRAKEAGRNQWCFYQSDMGEHDQRALTLEQSLRRALDNDALEVVYQPQAALEDKRLVGFEALLRWNDPELGIDWDLPPDTLPILSDKDVAGVPFRDAEVFE